MVTRCLLAVLLTLCPGCNQTPPQPRPLRFTAQGKKPVALAVYEAWFGLPDHISVGYSSNDPDVMRRQIKEAKKMGISGFVVDWYGSPRNAAIDDAPIDRNYAQMQALAAKDKFHVALMYDVKSVEVGATDEAIADLTYFHDHYLVPGAPGSQAYLTYQGRPIIFIFPGGDQTNWDQVRAAVNKWQPAPLLIQENLPQKYADAFDGFYPWINPGPKGWAPDGVNWGKEYLGSFYTAMDQKNSDKILVGGAWPQFDDSKASWGLNRHIAARCGQTFWDTFALWRGFVPSDQVIPFLLLETWNDYEEGSAIEPGIPSCGAKMPTNLQKGEKKAAEKSSKP